MLNEFQRVSYKLLGPSIARSLSLEKLETDIRKARLNIRAEAYMSTAIALTILSGFFGLIVSAFVFFVLLPAALPSAPKALLVLFPVVPMLMAVGTYSTFLAAPKKRSRALPPGQRIASATEVP